MSFFSNPLLLFCLALVAICLAWSGPLRKPRRKELSFGVVLRRLLMGATNSVEQDVSMTYNGHAVGELTEVIISVMNTGGIPIAQSDFERPPAVSLSEVKHVFSVETLLCSPVHLSPTITHTNAALTIAPMLLNPGDFLTIKLVVESTGRVGADLESRIAGVTTLPHLSAGAHPGYDLGSLMSPVLIFIFLIGTAIPLWLTDLLWGAVGTAAFALAVAFAAIVELKRILQLRRSRWMGKDTEDLAGDYGLHSKFDRRKGP